MYKHNIMHRDYHNDQISYYGRNKTGNEVYTL